MNNLFKKIVCPVDFSEQSERALIQAVAIAEQSGAELVLFRVIQPVPTSAFSGGMLFTNLNVMPDQSTDLAQKNLAVLREKFCTSILGRTSVQLATGIPFIEIAHYAREVKADLIVMGSHGLTGIEHLMLGSVAERVVRKAPCSVLVVRDAGHPTVS